MNHRTIKWQALCVILFFLTACTKIESTQLGSDLIPVVDNVNTFETILPVVANNYIDDAEYRLNRGNPHMVGAITQDPAFGHAKATLFFEMKPSAFPATPAACSPPRAVISRRVRIPLPSGAAIEYKSRSMLTGIEYLTRLFFFALAVLFLGLAMMWLGQSAVAGEKRGQPRYRYRFIRPFAATPTMSTPHEDASSRS